MVRFVARKDCGESFRGYAAGFLTDIWVSTVLPRLFLAAKAHGGGRGVKALTRASEHEGHERKRS